MWFHYQHAFALDYLLDKLHPECKVLDVGSGSGYLTACFARAIAAKGGSNNSLVVGVEHQPDLVKKGIDNISNDDPTLLDSRRVLIVGESNKFFFSIYSNFKLFSFLA